MTRAHPDEPGGVFGEVEGRDPEEKPLRILVVGVGDLILRALQAARGPRAVRTRLYPGALQYSRHKVPSPSDYPDGIAVARRAAQFANSLAQKWAEGARGEGTSWEELADSLGVPSAPYFTTTSRGELAWREYMKLRGYSDSRDLTLAEAQWRCTTCWEHVRDHGPGWHRGDPRRTESGHAGDCARHAAETAAWLAAHPEPDPSAQMSET